MRSYWNGEGRLQGLAVALDRLVPEFGKCYAASSMNKELDRYRRIAKAYYDLMNNGGMNLAQAIRAYTGYSVMYETPDFMEHVMTEVLETQITAAALEQLSLGTLHVPQGEVS